MYQTKIGDDGFCALIHHLKKSLDIIDDCDDIFFFYVSVHFCPDIFLEYVEYIFKSGPQSTFLLFSAMKRRGDTLVIF